MSSSWRLWTRGAARRALRLRSVFRFLVRVGELVLLPSGKRARVLAVSKIGEIDVLREDGEEFAICARHLRHIATDALAADPTRVAELQRVTRALQEAK